jgi:hypothetical protein
MFDVQGLPVQRRLSIQCHLLHQPVHFEVSLEDASVAVEHGRLTTIPC